MNSEPARRESRRTEHRRESQRQHHWTDAQKNILKPHLKQQWVIAPDASGAFVAAMEDVLEVYVRPHDPRRPRVSRRDLEATGRRDAHANSRGAWTQSATDYEYERGGGANLFMLFAPLEGFRHVKVTDVRTAIDYARSSRTYQTFIFRAPRTSCWFRIISHPHARLALRGLPHRPRPGGSSNVSNGITRLSTAAGSTWRSTSSAFSPRSVWIAASRTGKNRARSRRLEANRNTHHTKADWQFTTADARIKLKRLYPRLR